MALGTKSKRGIYRYGEDDSESTFSKLLNLGMDSVHDAVRGYSGTPSARALLTPADVAPGSIWVDTDAAGRVWRMTSTGWVRYSGETMLWSGIPLHLTDAQTITFDGGETFGSQPNGIIIRWSAYESGQARNWWWHNQYIPRRHLVAGGSAKVALAGGTATPFLAAKDVNLVGSNQLRGEAHNNAGNNAAFVIREVVGW